MNQSSSADFKLHVCVCLGLLHAGDRIIEVNGFSVDGMEPEQVIQVVVSQLSGREKRARI